MGDENDLEKTCCFFGHREIDETEELREWVKNTIENLIVEEGVDTFLFGSKSRFDSLCHELVTEAKKQYPPHKADLREGGISRHKRRVSVVSVKRIRRYLLSRKCGGGEQSGLYKKEL